MPKSVVAAIANRAGVVGRVVVTDLDQLYDHIEPEERVWIRPDFEVEEPVPYEKWGEVVVKTIQLATAYFAVNRTNAP